MIHVSLELQHEGEVHLFQQFTGYLREARAQWAAQGGFDAAPPGPGDLGAKVEPASDVVGLKLVDDAGNAITAAKPEVGITDADLEQAVTEFAKKNGTAAAVALLAKYGIKRLPELASADRARFYAEAWS